MVVFVISVCCRLLEPKEVYSSVAETSLLVIRTVFTFHCVIPFTLLFPPRLVWGLRENLGPIQDDP